ncbi:dual-specificity RNA methyltransferase RlmN [Clostridium senegalense]|uniref:23S rRNA (adenine(2503)-C(2))-methyltransferase RlmN n=1 Tax=Clostridium senegalense TaxID=1465809 RepID=UPI000287D1D9|nr:23S rRNA (adenine(2503)-C(2))-methyltransferase RlmN [Clostridium senegalense]MBU5225594.1 23S rRNA (adenine(2503)-C(2))-methyltransferase RlmN [Clostridium senegalense]
MKNILDLNVNELKLWMKENGESEFRAKQVFSWIYKYVYNFDDMKNLSKSTKEKLKDNFYIGVPKVLEKYNSVDGNTRKYLYKMKDNNLIESVVMQYKHGNSICVSTQVGCRMGCKFCASTIDGVVRNLTSGEILGQIIKAQEELGERISNVVLMGSGEPLDNFENVIKFLELVNADYGLNIGQRHITLSTCGIVPKIKELADKDMQITLAISLHAPNNEMRKQTMPIAKAFNIDELLEACNYYIDKTNRRITFEYALVKGFNDREEDALELSKILKGMLCHVNLIPINEIKESELKRANIKEINNFKDILIKNGIETTVRKEMGLDINAACGQLRRSYLEKKEL